MEDLLLLGEPGLRVYCQFTPGKIAKFNEQGEYLAQSKEEYEAILKSRSVFGRPLPNQEPAAPKEPKKEADKKRPDATKKPQDAAQKETKKETPEPPAQFHTITQEDLDGEPELAKKYKVGDKVNIEDL